jgi:hypothetical protein
MNLQIFLLFFFLVSGKNYYASHLPRNHSRDRLSFHRWSPLKKESTEHGPRVTFASKLTETVYVVTYYQREEYLEAESSSSCCSCCCKSSNAKIVVED